MWSMWTTEIVKFRNVSGRPIRFLLGQMAEKIPEESKHISWYWRRRLEASKIPANLVWVWSGNSLFVVGKPGVLIVHTGDQLC